MGTIDSLFYGWEGEDRDYILVVLEHFNKAINELRLAIEKTRDIDDTQLLGRALDGADAVIREWIKDRLDLDGLERLLKMEGDGNDKD